MINIPQTPLKFVLYYLAKTRWIFVLIFIIIPIMALCNQLIPWYVSKIISLVNSGTAPVSVWPQVQPLILYLGSIIVAAQLLSYLMNSSLQLKCIGPLGSIIRQDLFAKVLPQDKSFWNVQHAGAVYDKIEALRRSTAAQSSIGEMIMTVFYPLCIISVNLFLLATIYLPLCLIVAVSSTALIIAFFHITKNVSPLAAENTKLQAKVFGRVVDLISNFFLIKTFGSHKSERNRIAQDYTKLADMRSKYNLAIRKEILTQDSLFMIFQSSLIAYATFLWTQKHISVGDIVFILSTTRGFIGMLGGFCWTIADIQANKGTISKALEIFKLPYQITDIPDAKDLKKIKGEIEIKNLYFSYKDNCNVIHNLNLKIEPKQKVGIVGLSGCGKTTLLHLLQRIENTPENTVFVDGKDITKVTQESLHNIMSFIPQDTSLFHRTIKENLSYGKFDAQEKEIRKSAKEAFADKFINAYPLQYDTLVGDKGVKLSGGQRQRIGIARAILKKAPILLLDEATSALDSESEYYIQESLASIIKNKTVIAVAHRLSTLRNMDRIIVLDKGKIIEDGTPQELLKNGGKFAKLWNLQK